MYRLAKTLQVSVAELLEQVGDLQERATFEAFKSNVYHDVKEHGDIDCIIETPEKVTVDRYWFKAQTEKSKIFNPQGQTFKRSGIYSR